MNRAWAIAPAQRVNSAQNRAWAIALAQRAVSTQERAWAIAPAQRVDLPGIRSLVSTHARAGRLLPRDPGEISAHLHRWTVARLGRAVVGCVALERHQAALWEVRSLVVAETARGMGIASALVRTLVSRAQKAGAARIFALTCEGSLFARSGFSQVPDLEAGDRFHGRLLRPGCGVALAELRAKAFSQRDPRAKEEPHGTIARNTSVAMVPWTLPALAGRTRARRNTHERLPLAL